MAGGGIGAGGIANIVTGGVSALGNIGLGIANTAINSYWQGKNYEQQQKNLDYQKSLQQEIFAREDNAVQRRMEDLNKAGLSPLLAAGSAANAGSVIPTEAPQYDNTGVSDALGNLQTGLSESATLANEIVNTQYNREMQRQQIKSMKYQNMLSKAQAMKAITDAASETYYRNWDKKNGLGRNHNWWNDAAGTIEKILDLVKQDGGGKIDREEILKLLIGEKAQSGVKDIDEKITESAKQALEAAGEKLGDLAKEAESKYEEYKQTQAEKKAKKAENKLIEEQERKERAEKREEQKKKRGFFGNIMHNVSEAIGNSRRAGKI